MNEAGLKNITLTSRSSEDQSESINDFVAEEVAVAVTYNGLTHAVMMATPVDLQDFAIGFSITEGIIDEQPDLQAIEVRQTKHGIALQLQINPELAKRLASRQRSLSGRAGCGICGLTELAAAMPELEPLTPQPAPSHSAIDSAVAALQTQQKLQKACGGIHGAALCNSAGEIILVREDVGRHNALDKLIGAVLSSRSTPPFASDDFILMSSRASHELINKAALVGVSSLVTLSAATTLAIAVASKANLNLVGFIRGKRQLIYHQNREPCATALKQ